MKEQLRLKQKKENVSLNQLKYFTDKFCLNKKIFDCPTDKEREQEF